MIEFGKDIDEKLKDMRIGEHIEIPSEIIDKTNTSTVIEQLNEMYKVHGLAYVFGFTPYKDRSIHVYRKHEYITGDYHATGHHDQFQAEPLEAQ